MPHEMFAQRFKARKSFIEGTPRADAFTRAPNCQVVARGAVQTPPPSHGCSPKDKQHGGSDHMSKAHEL